MLITVNGLGHAGLTLAVFLAKIGHTVIGVDINSEHVERLQKNVLPYHSKKLKKTIIELRDNELLSFHDEVPSEAKNADMHWVAVQTPEGVVDEGSDVSFVLAATDILTGFVKDGSVVVYCSTVPVGTTHTMFSHLQHRLNFSVDFNVAFYPVFLSGDDSVEFFLNMVEHVIGADNEPTRKMFDMLFEGSAKNVPYFVDVNASEFIKMVDVGSKAVKLSYWNAVAGFAEKTGVDFKTVSKFFTNNNTDFADFNVVQTGFGGGEFIRSLKALQANSEAYNDGSIPAFVKTAQKTLSERLNLAFEKVKYGLGGDVSGKTVLFLGVAYKPDTDIIEYSSSMLLAHMLHNAGAKIVIHDPACFDVVSETATFMKTVKTLNSVKKLTNIDLMVVGCLWGEYKKIVPKDFLHIMNGSLPPVLDLTGQLNHIYWLTAGWNVDSMAGMNSF
jgi:UDPglucose 6-dehydrogenase